MMQPIILMVDANLQRENILPSERAFAYKMKLEAVETSGRTVGFNFPTTCREVGRRRILWGKNPVRAAGRCSDIFDLRN